LERLEEQVVVGDTVRTVQALAWWFGADLNVILRDMSR
jgi:hypothetical protein